MPPTLRPEHATPADVLAMALHEAATAADIPLHAEPTGCRVTQLPTAGGTVWRWSVTITSQATSQATGQAPPQPGRHVVRVEYAQKRWRVAGPVTWANRAALA
jgi:hypothetical protein